MLQRVNLSQVRDYVNIAWLQVILMTAAVCFAFTDKSLGEDNIYPLDDTGKIVFSQNKNDNVEKFRMQPSIEVEPEGNMD